MLRATSCPPRKLFSLASQLTTAAAAKVGAIQLSASQSAARFEQVQQYAPGACPSVVQGGGVYYYDS
jgi:hypothetical protein